MYSIITHDGDNAYGIYEYVCSSVKDLDKLTHCAPGSTAVILADDKEGAEIYMKSPDGKWKVL